jgi:hypothetical protein
VFFVIFCSHIRAQDITVTGSWSETIDGSDLQSGAGSDLIDTYESQSDQIIIDITGAGMDSWRVDVSKVDGNWHGNFQLYVRRTSDGIGVGPINGGTTYQEVTDTDQSFFDSQQSRTDIHVQLKLEGVSIQIPPDTYSTTVYYTVVNTG